MKIFDILRSEKLLDETDAFHEISDSITDTTYHITLERKAKNLVLESERENRIVLKDKVATHKKLANSNKVSAKAQEIRQLEQELIPGAEQKIRQIQSDLHDAFEVKRRQEQELNKFKEVNKLRAAARYNEDLKKVWTWIAAALVGESALNAFFLAKASEFGLAGGFAIALSVSLINVVLGFFFSKGFQNAHHIESKRSAFGSVGMAVTVLLVGTLALFIGHYRAAIDTNVESAAFQAVLSMLDNPFGISTFDSWILVVITCVIFAVVAFKFSTNDEVYPGYGNLDRNTKQAKDKYSLQKTKAMELIRDQKTELFDKFEVTFQVLEDLSGELDEDNEAIAQLESDYFSYLSQQKNEFEAYCDECRKRFTSECKLTLNKQPTFNTPSPDLDIPALDPLLSSSDKGRFEEMKGLIRKFVNDEYSPLRESFHAKVHALYTEAEAEI